jgi:hypothetical protein
MTYHAFRPLVDLQPSPHATLSAAAVSHWLSCDRFDDWGAFTYLRGSTRLQLARAGVPLTAMAGAADRIFTANRTWNRLWHGYRSGALAPADRLYLIRLLLYLGFYRDARQHANDCASLDEAGPYRGWLAYLEGIAKQVMAPLAWDPRPLDEARLAFGEGAERLAFLIDLQLGSHHARVTVDVPLAESYLAGAETMARSVGEPEPVEQLLLAHVDRQRAGLRLRQGDVAQYRYLAERAYELLGGRTEFLHREAAARLSRFAAAAERARGNRPRAARWAQRARLADPYTHCAGGPPVELGDPPTKFVG